MPRSWIGGLPERMAALPVDHRGFPVPFFVEWQDGPNGEKTPLFPVMDSRKMQRSISTGACWVCGQPTGAYKCFVIGPMCCINKINSEPPSHYECARFSALNCPFLSKPLAKRTTGPDGKYKDVPVKQPAGIMIERNPGVTCVWVTKSYKIIRVQGGGGAGAGVLWELGPAVRMEFYALGRPATRAEVEESIRTGLPALERAAERDGPDGVKEMRRRHKTFLEALDEVKWQVAA